MTYLRFRDEDRPRASRLLSQLPSPVRVLRSFDDDDPRPLYAVDDEQLALAHTLLAENRIHFEQLFFTPTNLTTGDLNSFLRPRLTEPNDDREQPEDGTPHGR